MWESWIGKKHGWRHDPVTSSRADCLLMTVRVREQLGLPVPSEREQLRLFALARKGLAAPLLLFLDRATARLGDPEDGAFHVSTEPFGVSVVVAGGLLYVHHEKGVQWTALGSIDQSALQWRHWNG